MSASGISTAAPLSARGPCTRRLATRCSTEHVGHRRATRRAGLAPHEPAYDDALADDMRAQAVGGSGVGHGWILGCGTTARSSRQEDQVTYVIAQPCVDLKDRACVDECAVNSAAIPGRPAPKLIPASAVKAMRRGSVIVDLAAETGGNCELTRPGETVVAEGVTIVGLLNLPSEMPSDASQLYARNVKALLQHLAPEGELALDWDDEITAGACVTRKEARRVNQSFLIELTILILAIFVGIEVISKVPTLLHTPLMSGTNAIHGIVIVGAIIVAGFPTSRWLRIVSLAAVALGTGNVVGGFVVTDRMLEMFKRREGRREDGRGEPKTANEPDRRDLRSRIWSRSSASSSRSGSSRTRRRRGTATGSARSGWRSRSSRRSSRPG